MDKKQYLELCEACDHLLLSPDVKIERIAISWLHVIRAHPMFLKNYENLFQNKIVSKNQLLLDLRIFLSTSLRLLKLFLKNSIWWTKSHQIEDKIDILFVSHLVSDSHSGQETDFYFGDLALKLLDSGVTSSFALINHTKKPVENFAGKWNESKIPRYILSDAIGFSHEVNFYIKSLLESRSLNKYSKSFGSELVKRVASRAAYEARLGGAIPSMRIGKQIGKLVRNLSPRFVITTYEGHAFERIIYAEARNINPNIYCFGYQHAAIFPLQHSLKRNLANRFNPDAILTSGLVAFEELKKVVDLKGIDFGILGSNRGFQIQKNPDLSKNESTCLVLPEGEITECIILFKFSLACSKICPDMKFIWRLHPLVTFKEIEKEIEGLSVLPENIKLSTCSIEDDINNSNFVLYRGTTAIIPAINSGLIPIYYHTGEFIIDPIADNNDEKFYVKDINDFLLIVKSENLLFSCESENFMRIKKHSNNIFTEFNPNIILEKINSITYNQNHLI